MKLTFRDHYKTYSIKSKELFIVFSHFFFSKTCIAIHISCYLTMTKKFFYIYLNEIICFASRWMFFLSSWYSPNTYGLNFFFRIIFRVARLLYSHVNPCVCCRSHMCHIFCCDCVLQYAQVNNLCFLQYFVNIKVNICLSFSGRKLDLAGNWFGQNWPKHVLTTSYCCNYKCEILN